MNSFLFGYGSLVWKADFEYVNSYTGYINGYGRRFWQGSPDHRGTEECPGRVATLLTLEELGDDGTDDKVWGVVYEIEKAVEVKVLAHLDHREKAGYEKNMVDVHCQDKVTRNAIVFRATPDNDHYLGPDDNGIVHHIASSHGPSGPNREYFDNLVLALNAMSDQVGENCVDDHLVQINQGLLRFSTHSPSNCASSGLTST